MALVDRLRALPALLKDRAWARCAALSAPRAADRLGMPRCTEMVSVRAVAASESYCAEAASIWRWLPT